MNHFFESSIKPRFSETDMRGHINNTVIPIWLADGRAALFREELGSTLTTMVVNLNVDFKNELHWGSIVTARTAVEKIGNSSICFVQQLWQNGQKCVEARTTIVALDAQSRKPISVPSADRVLLSPYVMSAEHLTGSTPANTDTFE